jgi:hypothetical protein
MKILPTSKWTRALEAFIELAVKLVGVFVVYRVFDWLLSAHFQSLSGQDNLMSLLLLPSLYILKDISVVLEPFTVVVEQHNDKISVFCGVAPRVKDTLEFKSVENIEVVTTLIGRFRNYGTIRLYSPGGSIEMLYVYDPNKVVKEIEAKKNNT